MTRRLAGVGLPDRGAREPMKRRQPLTPQGQQRTRDAIESMIVTLEGERLSRRQARLLATARKLVRQKNPNAAVTTLRRLVAPIHAARTAEAFASCQETGKRGSLFLARPADSLKSSSQQEELTDDRRRTPDRRRPDPCN